MPEVDGLTLAEKIRSHQEISHLPLIMLTSVSGQIYVDRARELGIEAYHTKPVRQAKLIESLSHLLQPQEERIKSGKIKPRPYSYTENRPDLKILVVEDNLVNQRVVMRILERIGYHSDVVDNGRKAVEAVQEKSYNVLLMDVQMPEMDGLEATRQIRKILPPEHQPWIIALTANALLDDQRACKEAGMNDYVSKPIEIEKLAQTLQNAIIPQSMVAEPQPFPTT